MNRPGDRPAAADRSRWLAELAEAIDQAQRLARSLSLSKGDSPDAKDLHDRLEAVRLEVEDLRRGGWGTRPKGIDPLWTSLFPWNGSQQH